MKVLVSGGRDFDDLSMLMDRLDRLHAMHPITKLIHGGARGVDTMAGQWADVYGIPVEVYPADWKKYGKSAGYRRNAQMLREGEPDEVVVFPGGKGTQMMAKLAREKGYYVIEAKYGLRGSQVVDRTGRMTVSGGMLHAVRGGSRQVFGTVQRVPGMSKNVADVVTSRGRSFRVYKYTRYNKWGRNVLGWWLKPPPGWKTWKSTKSVRVW